jgi:hypothetical protein
MDALIVRSEGGITMADDDFLTDLGNLIEFVGTAGGKLVEMAAESADTVANVTSALSTAAGMVSGVVESIVDTAGPLLSGQSGEDGDVAAPGDGGTAALAQSVLAHTLTAAVVAESVVDPVLDAATLAVDEPTQTAPIEGRKQPTPDEPPAEAVGGMLPSD